MIGLSSDDVIYLLFMVISVAAGPVFRSVLIDKTSRRWASALIGFLLLAVVCGPHTVHLVITVVGNCVLLKLCPPTKNERDLPGKSFIWNFGYLAVFRTVHWVGIPAPSPVTNAAQLFLTLRMIGIAFEIQDSFMFRARAQESGDANKSQEALLVRYCTVDVGPAELVSYAFCYIGILTGPYYKYRTFQDWLELPVNANLNVKQTLTERVIQLPVIAFCFWFFSRSFNIEYVETIAFLERPFLFRLFYMVPMFIIFRTRLYMAWIMSEIMSVTAGLGAYPAISKPQCGQGPTDYSMLDTFYTSPKKVDQRYNFETVHNIDIYGCELAPLTKQGLRSWNMTVQYWLATYIHRRVPPALKANRVAITMTVSAFWHGIHPGYYLSFLTVPPILMAEETMIKAFRKEASPLGQQLFDWACWFFKMRGFDYMCMGFLLLRLGSTLRYWYSIYFLGHLVMLSFLAIGHLALALKPKKPKAQ
ncbi:lysophospholipid acyltransferase 7 [Aplysia californica]|uniref:Lysophospholipid acyltransferase 7 n=1 Tax=Aplysia californica TaxID=6500 RepID=A0ABM0JRY7_APLCA|nr:lysophospholipid acyltransferase 7 [Aplysia californica]